MNTKNKRTNLLAFVGASLGMALVGRAVARRRARMDFSGKSVVITGGSRGLGLVLARQFAQQGARLALLDREADELVKAERELLAMGADVQSITCDVGDQAQFMEALGAVIRRRGRIDVLVNNAGVIQVGPLEHMTLEDFEQAMAVHFWGPLYGMLAAAPYMRQQGGGRIVNITSIGGVVAVPHLAPYVASKFASVGLSDVFRAELAKDNIAVTTVVPGLMRTGSHVNALFKGRNRREYAWFSILDALPFTSTDSRKAARQIIEACRYGKVHQTITIQARLIALLNAVFPGLMGVIMKITNRFLPKPVYPWGEIANTGWESQSRLSPSLLTVLADRAVERNNQLSGHPPIVQHSGSRIAGSGRN